MCVYFWNIIVLIGQIATIFSEIFMRLSLFFYTCRGRENAIFLSATNVCTTMFKFISSQFFANRLIVKDLLLENVDVIGDGNCIQILSAEGVGVTTAVTLDRQIYTTWKIMVTKVTGGLP